MHKSIRDINQKLVIWQNKIIIHNIKSILHIWFQHKMQHYTSIFRWTLQHLHNIFDLSWNHRFQFERNFCFETEKYISYNPYICIRLEVKVVERNLPSVVNRRWTVLELHNFSIIFVRYEIMEFVFRSVREVYSMNLNFRSRWRRRHLQHTRWCLFVALETFSVCVK